MPNEFSLSDTTYGKFKNVSQYNDFLKNKNIFLKGMPDPHPIYVIIYSNSYTD